MGFGIPALAYRFAKLVYPMHQTLAFKRADGSLIRNHQKDSHRLIRRGKELFLFDRGALGKRLERGCDEAERIERKLELRARRTCLDLLTQTIKAITNFVWLQERHCLVECARLQIEQQRHRDRLQIANAIRRGHGRTSEPARAPRLLAQAFSKHRRELLQFVDITRMTDQRER